MAHKRTVFSSSAVWTVYFNDANEPYHVQRLESVWSIESGAANEMMTERIRRIIELAKQIDNSADMATEQSTTAEIERVARALCRRALWDEYGIENDDPEMQPRIDREWCGYMWDARVAIEALRND